MKKNIGIDAELMRRGAEDATRLLRVMGNPHRLMLLCFLSRQEYCVSELASVSGISQPPLSQQLTGLREERLISDRRVGKHIYYSCLDSPALPVMQVLYHRHHQSRRASLGARPAPPEAAGPDPRLFSRPMRTPTTSPRPASMLRSGSVRVMKRSQASGQYVGYRIFSLTNQLAGKAMLASTHLNFSNAASIMLPSVLTSRTGCASVLD